MLCIWITSAPSEESNREQKGPATTATTANESTVETIATASEVPAPKSDGVMTDEDLAASYRSQADAMFKEAKRLREEAEELAPTKKKSVKASA